MLRGLHIYDMLLIDRLELDFQSGLNVLTGETGAGKSILLDSLGFVLGWRGRADLVRKGSEQGEVNAWFDLSETHPAHKILNEAGLPSNKELSLRRTNTSDGRKTSYVNDRRVSGDVLRQLSDCLVELHGQHDDRGLLNPRGHRALLDAFGGIDTGEVRRAWKEKTRLQKELKAAKSAHETAKSDQEYLQHSLTELQNLGPIKGEEEELDARRRLMQASEKIREDISKAANALGGEGAEGSISDATRWLEGSVDKAEGRLDDATKALSRAYMELADAQRGVEECLEALSFDPQELEETEERLFALRGLARKHNILPDALEEFSTDLAVKLKAIDVGAEKIEALEIQVSDAQEKYNAEAEKLSISRFKASETLEEEMQGELAPLKLERAEFVVEMSETEAGQDGQDEVVFMVATNPGAPAGPINKIASGGELSRFLLALKVCLTRRAEGLTLIFDEIDRGVGGATADAVGARLREIAGKAQVLVVTHSPQVAAKGAHQWRVSKSVRSDVTYSTVEKLISDERVDEIARMLAGDKITDEARAAARALLT